MKNVLTKNVSLHFFTTLWWPCIFIRGIRTAVSKSSFSHLVSIFSLPISTSFETTSEINGRPTERLTRVLALVLGSEVDDLSYLPVLWFLALEGPAPLESVGNLLRNSSRALILRLAMVVPADLSDAIEPFRLWVASGLATPLSSTRERNSLVLSTSVWATDWIDEQNPKCCQRPPFYTRL